MIRILILVFLCIIQLTAPGVTALQLKLSSANPVPAFTSATFQWNAVDTDPDTFTMQGGAGGGDAVPFSNVIRGGALEGFGSSPILPDTGTYYLEAIDSNGQLLTNEIVIEVSSPQENSISETSSQRSSTAASTTTHSTNTAITSVLSSILHTTFSETDPTTSSTAPQISSDDSASSTNLLQNSFTSSPSQTSNILGQFMSTRSFTTSTRSSDLPALNTGSSVLSHRRKTTAVRAGIISAVLVIAALMIGGLLIHRRRQRRRKLSSRPYQTHLPDGSAVIGPTKNNIISSNTGSASGPGMHSEKHTAEEPEMREREPTDRQRILQDRAEEITRQIAESENILHNEEDASPAMRVLMTENIRQNAEIQRLRELISSDWALGLTDNPPPSYPHSEATSQ